EPDRRPRRPAPHPTADFWPVQPAAPEGTNQAGGIKGGRLAACLLMPLEVLHFPLMPAGRGAGGKGAEIAPLSGARIFLARVQAILAGPELADHKNLLHLLPNRSRHSPAAGHDVVELDEVQ